MNTSSFNLEELMKAKAFVDALPRVCVGIAARPDIAGRLQCEIKAVEREIKSVQAPPEAVLPGLLGIPVFTVRGQREPWIPFYDDAALRAYLQQME